MGRQGVPKTLPNLWRPDDVAAYLRCSRQHVYNLVKDNGLPCSKVGKRLIFMPHKVEEWVENNDPSHEDMLRLVGKDKIMDEITPPCNKDFDQMSTEELQSELARLDRNKQVG